MPVPLCTVAEVLGWRGVTAADEKISKVSDQAAGSTSELLREVRGAAAAAGGGPAHLPAAAAAAHCRPTRLLGRCVRFPA